MTVGVRTARRAVRWGMHHGAVRLALFGAARRGDLQARLVVDRAARMNPYPLHDELRARGPLVRGRLTRISATHAVCSEVLRSDDFRSGGPALPRSPAVRALHEWSRAGRRTMHPVEAPSLLAVEAPDHTRYRGLVAKVFTARAVEALRSRVQETADALLDDLAAGGDDVVDLVEVYCAQLPLAVISDILGVPAAERARVLGFGAGVAPSIDAGLSWSEFRRVADSLEAFDTWLGVHLETLRRNPGPDLLSQLVTVRQDGRGLTELELRSTAGLLLAAGFETTVNLLSSGTDLLLRHPAELAALRSDPGLWANAVEEVLRFESPVQATGRVAARDTSVAGIPVPAGQMVAVTLAGANRDPAVFDDPQRFDVGRANAREHLSFSAGRHFCLGAALARIEGEVGLRSLFERFPDVASAPGATRRRTRVLRGWEELPVRLGGGPAPA